MRSQFQVDPGLDAQRYQAFVELCRTYDGLLEPGTAAPSEAARADLATYAKVLDLDGAYDEASPAEIWRQVRLRLAQEVGVARRDLGSTAPLGFQPKVFLPAARPPAGAAFVGDDCGGLNLMVVEDDSDLAAALIEALHDGGHRVVAQAASADEALVRAALHPLDLAIVDVNLADGSSGVDVARALQERWGVAALFLSGDRNEHLVEFESAVGFLGKPFTAAELLAAVTLVAPLLGRA